MDAFFAGEVSPAFQPRHVNVAASSTTPSAGDTPATPPLSGIPQNSEIMSLPPVTTLPVEPLGESEAGEPLNINSEEDEITEDCCESSLDSCIFSFYVEEKLSNTRLDVCILRNCYQVRRQQVQRAIEDGQVTVDGNVCLKSSKKIASGQHIICTFKSSDVEPSTAPEAIDIPIIFEDDHLIVLEKPSGLVVHPAPGHPSHTLVNALVYHFPPIASVGDPLRPGIVHRLDAETTGIMLAAKTQAAFEALKPLFAEHAIRRTYNALCYAPQLPDSGIFDTFYGRNPNVRIKYSSKLLESPRRAITEYKVLQRFCGGYALVECKLKTGRTHQIRVHLSDHLAYILADKLYSPSKIAKSKLISRMALHSKQVSFIHPITHESLEFEIALPHDMQNAINSLTPL